MTFKQVWPKNKGYRHILSQRLIECLSYFVICFNYHLMAIKKQFISTWLIGFNISWWDNRKNIRSYKKTNTKEISCLLNCSLLFSILVLYQFDIKILVNYRFKHKSIDVDIMAQVVNCPPTFRNGWITKIPPQSTHTCIDRYTCKHNLTSICSFYCF